MYEVKDENVDEIKKITRTIEGKIYICGAGYRGEILARWFNVNSIRWEGFIDKNKKGELCGKKIYSYDKIREDNDKICIWISSSVNKKDMLEEIQHYNINNNSIITFYDAIAFEPILHDYFDDVTDELNDLKICDLKNIHLGKRAFIIGNGPSLAINDLEKIKDEISFGVNEIYYTYSSTKWRPTYYVCEDPISTYYYLNSEKDFYNVIKDSKKALFSRYSYKYLEYGGEKNRFDNLIFYKKRDLRLPRKDYIASFSSDISQIIYTIGTVIYPVYQIAAFMGIKEIYLLGMDCSFAKEMDIYGNYYEHSKKENHMKLIPKEISNSAIYQSDQIFCAHASAKHYADAHGLKIYNATRGGKLEVFDRVDFDSLFN